MKFQQLRAFHAIASEGGVGRAARRLAVTQPTLSQHIKALEDRFGVALFEREGRRLRLTPIGERLYKMTSQLMTSWDEIENLLNQNNSVNSGRLRIGSDAPMHAVELLQRYKERYPNIDVSIRIQPGGAVLEQLEAANMDVAILVTPPAGGDFYLQPLNTEPLMAVVPAQHPIAAEGAVSLARLAAETMILREKRSMTRAAIEAELQARGLAPRAILEISSREAIREAIARGLGVTLMVTSDCVPDPRLANVPLDIDDRTTHLTEYVVTRQDRRRTPIIREFLDIALAYAGELARRRL
ncbi:LysR substrate-binding domain-containing protein [Pannonibacter tanglangensis]|uniref:LysR family transcriptional regulator n=1 Tax=Pannonibacter tanglangensis TaxID=2750084 RepID=A0ABW9ZID3_9HYPH|nr:LysR substrate-binding domain-containing protein [Pannonibacter sp. XCT-34]NBN64625.1 LysR family transcriptional regulator [Pannonibacter sp. XCT-34]